MKIKFRNTILCKENHSREIMANMIDKELNLSWKNIEKKYKIDKDKPMPTVL